MLATAARAYRAYCIGVRYAEQGLFRGISSSRSISFQHPLTKNYEGVKAEKIRRIKVTEMNTYTKPRIKLFILMIFQKI